MLSAGAVPTRCVPSSVLAPSVWRHQRIAVLASSRRPHQPRDVGSSVAAGSEGIHGTREVYKGAQGEGVHGASYSWGERGCGGERGELAGAGSAISGRRYAADEDPGLGASWSARYRSCPTPPYPILGARLGRAEVGRRLSVGSPRAPRRRLVSASAGRWGTYVRRIRRGVERAWGDVSGQARSD